MNKIKEKSGKVKKIIQKYTDVDKHLALNWKHVLKANTYIRMTSRGIKIGIVSK